MMVRGAREFTEPDLFSLSRATDPSTSRGAAEDIAAEVKGIQAAVLAWARTQPVGFIDRALVEAFAGRHGPSTVRTRRAELVDKKLIRHRAVEGVPQYVTVGSSGRRHIVWEAVP